jgi:hypothetical protein
MLGAVARMAPARPATPCSTTKFFIFVNGTKVTKMEPGGFGTQRPFLSAFLDN